MNKEKFTRVGLEPATSGLTCRGSIPTELHVSSPTLAVSLFCQSYWFWKWIILTGVYISYYFKNVCYIVHCNTIRGTGIVHCNSERTGEFDMWTSHTGGIYIHVPLYAYTHMFWIIFMCTTMMVYTVQDYFNFNCAHGSMEDMWFIHYN